MTGRLSKALGSKGSRLRDISKYHANTWRVSVLCCSASVGGCSRPSAAFAASDALTSSRASNIISFDAIGRLRFGPLYPNASGLPNFSACTGTSARVI